jgi:hypothetical protein
LGWEDAGVSGWGGYEKNVLYSPEACGLRLIGELADADEFYDFDTVIVVQDVASGRIYAGHDSGCSCPTPFEDVHSLGDLTEIRTVDEIRSFVKAHEEYVNWPLAEQQALYRKVREVLP